LRILHLPKWYPHRYDDQDGDFVARHVAASAAHGGPAGGPTRAAVVFAAVARGPLTKLIEEDHDLSGPVPTWRYYYRAQLSGWGALDRVLKLGLWLACQRRGLRAARAHWDGAGPDIVHAHVMFRPAVLAAWWRWRYGWPYVLTENWTVFQPGNVERLGRGRRWLAGWLVRRAAAWTPVSQDLRRAFSALGGVNPRTVVIPNVVDTDLFRPPPAPAARRGLLSVAAFNEAAKNLSGVLRVVARLRATHPDLSLRVAGYGPAEASLRQLARELGLLTDGPDSPVVFLGKIPSAQVAVEMRRAVALVLFSNYENLPCVLIEAQASGLPAVATAVNGVPELLPADGAAGLLVPPRDEAALAAALTTVLTAPAGRFDAAAMRARALAEFSVPAVGRAFGAVYTRILSR